MSKKLESFTTDLRPFFTYPKQLQKSSYGPCTPLSEGDKVYDTP